MTAFLRKYPSETVIMSYQQNNACSTRIGVLDCQDDYHNTKTFTQTLQKYIDDDAYRKFIYKMSNSSSQVPKLKKVRGKIVLLDFGNDGQQGLRAPWAWKTSETVANNWEPKCWGTTGFHCKEYIQSLL